MSNKELFKLAGTSFKRQKGSRLVVVSLTCAFIMLMVSSWLIFSFFGYMSDTVNDVPRHTYDIHLERHEDLPKDLYRDVETMLVGNEYLEYFAFEFDVNRGGISEYFTVDGTVYNNKNFETKNELNYVTGIKFINTELSKNKICLTSTEEYLSGINIPVYLKGNGFYGDAARQVVVSERFVDTNGLNLDDVIGKKVSYELKNYNNYKYVLDSNLLDKDNNPDNGELNVYQKEELVFNIKIFADYEIVGVVADEFFTLGSKYDFIMSDTNLDRDDLSVAWMPVYTMPDSDYEAQSTLITGSGKVYPFLYLGSYDSEWIQAGIENNLVIMRDYMCNDFNQFKNIFGYVDDAYVDDVIDSHNIYRIFRSETNFTFEYRILENVGILLCILGLIIFAAVIINLYNILMFNALERKKILIIYKSIGFSEKKINLLYFYECFAGFLKAFLYSLLGAVALVITLVFAVQEIIRYLGADFNVMFALAYLPISLLVISILSMAIVYVIYLATRNTIKNMKLHDYENQ